MEMELTIGVIEINIQVINFQQDFWLGEYIKDLRDGYGECYFSDGSAYKGQWKKGKQDGHGKIITRDGNEIEGEWINGNKI